MARRARKKSVVKARKVKRAATRGKVKTKPGSKTATKTKKKAARRPRPKARADGIADKVAGAFRTVVDTFKETGALRKKMQPPGSEP